jgi:hypothetical protein
MTPLEFVFWQSLASAALPLFLLLPSARLSPPLRHALLLALLALALVPINGLSPATYLRSVFDDLALTTSLALLLGTVVRLGWMARPPEAQLTLLLWLFAGMAVVLYPAALGLTFVDPYRLGFAPRLLLAGVGLLSLGLLWQRHYLGCLLLSVATLGFVLQLKGSTNYWDYLIDPALATFCMGVLLRRHARRFIPSRYRSA